MNLIKIYKADLLNGKGLRNVYFFSGCSHHCKGCFNPETADFNTPLAKLWTLKDFQQLIDDSKYDYIDGITLSGGDPLYIFNVKDIYKLCKEYKKIYPNKTIWCYTGYTWENINKFNENSYIRKVLKYIDVLCEGPFIESLKSPSKPWVGSSNQRVINVFESLKNNKIVLAYE